MVTLEEVCRMATLSECFYRYPPWEGFSDEQLVKRHRFGRALLHFTATERSETYDTTKLCHLNSQTWSN